MHSQKSAEAIVATRDRGEGPNDDTESRTTELVLDRDDRSAVESGGPAEVSEPTCGWRINGWSGTRVRRASMASP
jgi:predicted phage gp36 major capsid-like protein